MRVTRVVLPSLLALLALPSVLRADPPARIARLSYFQGSVSFRPASADDWSDAGANYPLTTGDHLWADDDARGELHVGGGSVVRLGARTAFSLLNLDDQTAQMRISSGSLEVTVSRLDEDEVVEVDTPNAAVSLLRTGVYRLDVNEDGDRTTVTVRHGEAEVTAGGAAVSARPGDAVLIRGVDEPRYDVRDADDPDDWENWCLDRDRRDERAEARRYVSEDVVGYEDLDENGRWRDDAEYGHVWFPTRVEADWAPYRDGHWAFVAPWGWTWVDDAPWGFAPFHYGRWAHRDAGWCWGPGERVGRPVYAPALVAFVGGGDFSLSLSIGRSGVAWFPLAPREVYVPPYRVSADYIRSVNVTNVTNISDINVRNGRYANQRVGGAVTAVPREIFVSAQSVARARVLVSVQAAAAAQVRAETLSEIQPQREGFVAKRDHAVVRPPAAVQERPVVARVVPPTEQAHVRQGFVEGRSVSLKPSRQGLPDAQEVRSSDRPKPRSAAGERSTDRPVDRSNERPNSARPSSEERVTEQRSARPSRQPNERPGEHSLERPPSSKPPSEEPAAERRSDRPEERPSERPVERSLERPGPTPKPPNEERATERRSEKPSPPPEERGRNREESAHEKERVNEHPSEHQQHSPEPTPHPEPKKTPKPSPTPTPR